MFLAVYLIIGILTPTQLQQPDKLCNKGKQCECYVFVYSATWSSAVSKSCNQSVSLSNNMEYMLTLIIYDADDSEYLYVNSVDIG